MDDRGRRFHIELILLNQEQDLASDWKRRRRYNFEDRDRFSGSTRISWPSTCGSRRNGHEAALYGRVRPALLYPCPLPSSGWDRRAPRYKPIGVWVQGPSHGLDLVIEFLPGNTWAREEAEWIINHLVENDIRALPDCFLAYHQSTLSPYWGMCGRVVETEE